MPFDSIKKMVRKRNGSYEWKKNSKKLNHGVTSTRHRLVVRDSRRNDPTIPTDEKYLKPLKAHMVEDKLHGTIITRVA